MSSNTYTISIYPKGEPLNMDSFLDILDKIRDTIVKLGGTLGSGYQSIGVGRDIPESHQQFYLSEDEFPMERFTELLPGSKVWSEVKLTVKQKMK